MSDGEAHNPTDLKALEEFVVNNEELLQLEERIGRFNIFDALSIVNTEIRHSNFLAWLLDPNESHGQGPLFLKAVLMDLLRQSPPELRPLSPVQIDGAELRGVEIRREWRNIDILITCKDPGFVIAIENKVGSKEHSDQLGRYRKIVADEFGGTRRQFVFLTREGDEPTDEGWTAYTYEDIHRVLSRARKANAASIGDDVLAFLNHYIRLIGSRFMDDPTIDDLCQTIYKNHRAAIDLIIDRGRPDPVDVSVLGEVLMNDRRFTIFKSGRRGYDFIPKHWEILPDRNSFEGSGRPWIKWFVCVEPTIAFVNIEVGPCNDQDLRTRVIDKIVKTEEQYNIKLSRRKITPTYTRLAGKTLARWSHDNPPEPDKVADVFRKLLDTWFKQFDGLANDLLPVLKEE